MEPTVDIRDIKGIDPLPPGLLWLWILVGLFLAATVIWWLWRRRRKKEDTSQTTLPSLTPYEVATKAFQQIIQDGLIDRGEVTLFYTRLSDVIRHYLEGQFHLHAPERTTEEFLYEVSHDQSLSAEHKELLRAFLQESDLVKFAKFSPGLSEMKNALSAAESFVHDTRTVPSPSVTAHSQTHVNNNRSDLSSTPVASHP